MNLNNILKPEENIWLRFNEADANIMGEKGEEAHGPSRIYYGYSQDRFGLYILPLADLRKFNGVRFPWAYYRLNDHTIAKRTLTGGLRIRRWLVARSRSDCVTCEDLMGEATPSRKEYATLSRKEYRELRQYI